MKISDDQMLEIIAYEAFIRRAAEINLPFMLKGSYVTRQYFPNPEDRIPADLDWVYLGELADENIAREKFDEWAIQVTELEKSDGVLFESFRKNQFWRMIDYAMADDFPTVNTDIKCWVDGKELELAVDLSFNLDIEQPPVTLQYKPLRGEPFTILNTVPLSLQVSWKIHQTLVRPRFKDLLDLMHLVQHPAFDNTVLNASLQALINECSADNVDLQKLRLFLCHDVQQLFVVNSMEMIWNYWRHGIIPVNHNGIIYQEEEAKNITDIAQIPNDLFEFLAQYKKAMESAGFGIHLMDMLPAATRQKRKTYRPPIYNPRIREQIKPSIPAEIKPVSFFNFITKYFK